MQKLVTAGLTFPSGASHDPSTIEWESVMLDGADLGTIITRAAKTSRADLIFMRSRRRPLAPALLGSTAEAVSRLAPCPVLVWYTYILRFERRQGAATRTMSFADRSSDSTK